jgi:hypothetical protein
MKKSPNDAVAEVVTSITVVEEEYVDLNRMECRDTQTSCIAAESLAGPPEAC